MEKLTILIPAYNEERYILETLKSIQKQTFQNFVCLIADNNSTDNTGKICIDFAKNDSRFIYHKQEKNIGSIKNIEFLMDMVQSEYIMLFSGHDVIEIDFLKELMGVITTNNDVSLVFCKALGINEKSVIIDNEFMHQSYDFTGDCLSRYIKSIQELGNCTIVQGIFRTSVLKNFELAYDTTGVDHILLSRILWFGKLFIVDKVLYKRRFFEHRESTSQERVSSTGEKTIDMNFFNMYKEYLKDFNKLYTGPEEFRTFLNSKILDILTRRFGISHLYKETK